MRAFATRVASLAVAVLLLCGAGATTLSVGESEAQSLGQAQRMLRTMARISADAMAKRFHELMGGASHIRAASGSHHSPPSCSEGSKGSNTTKGPCCQGLRCPFSAGVCCQATKTCCPSGTECAPPSIGRGTQLCRKLAVASHRQAPANGVPSPVGVTSTHSQAVRRAVPSVQERMAKAQQAVQNNGDGHSNNSSSNSSNSSDNTPILPDEVTGVGLPHCECPPAGPGAPECACKYLHTIHLKELAEQNMKELEKEMMALDALKAGSSVAESFKHHTTAPSPTKQNTEASNSTSTTTPAKPSSGSATPATASTEKPAKTQTKTTKHTVTSIERSGSLGALKRVTKQQTVTTTVRSDGKDGIPGASDMKAAANTAVKEIDAILKDLGKPFPKRQNVTVPSWAKDMASVSEEGDADHMDRVAKQIWANEAQLRAVIGGKVYGDAQWQELPERIQRARQIAQLQEKMLNAQDFGVLNHGTIDDDDDDKRDDDDYTGQDTGDLDATQRRIRLMHRGVDPETFGWPAKKLLDHVKSLWSDFNDPNRRNPNRKRRVQPKASVKQPVVVNVHVNPNNPAASSIMNFRAVHEGRGEANLKNDDNDDDEKDDGEKKDEKEDEQLVAAGLAAVAENTDDDDDGDDGSSGNGGNSTGNATNAGNSTQQAANATGTGTSTGNSTGNSTANATTLPAQEVTPLTPAAAVMAAAAVTASQQSVSKNEASIDMREKKHLLSLTADSEDKERSVLWTVENPKLFRMLFCVARSDPTEWKSPERTLMFGNECNGTRIRQLASNFKPYLNFVAYDQLQQHTRPYCVQSFRGGTWRFRIKPNEASCDSPDWHQDFVFYAYPSPMRAPKAEPGVPSELQGMERLAPFCVKESTVRPHVWEIDMGKKVCNEGKEWRQQFVFYAYPGPPVDKLSSAVRPSAPLPASPVQGLIPTTDNAAALQPTVVVQQVAAPGQTTNQAANNNTTAASNNTAANNTAANNTAASSGASSSSNATSSNNSSSANTTAVTNTTNSTLSQTTKFRAVAGGTDEVRRDGPSPSVTVESSGSHELTPIKPQKHTAGGSPAPASSQQSEQAQAHAPADPPKPPQQQQQQQQPPAPKQGESPKQNDHSPPPAPQNDALSPQNDAISGNMEDDSRQQHESEHSRHSVKQDDDYGSDDPRFQEVYSGQRLRGRMHRLRQRRMRHRRARHRRAKRAKYVVKVTGPGHVLSPSPLLGPIPTAQDLDHQQALAAMEAFAKLGHKGTEKGGRHGDFRFREGRRDDEDEDDDDEDDDDEDDDDEDEDDEGRSSSWQPAPMQAVARVGWNMPWRPTLPVGVRARPGWGQQRREGRRRRRQEPRFKEVRGSKNKATQSKADDNGALQRLKDYMAMVASVPSEPRPAPRR